MIRTMLNRLAQSSNTSAPKLSPRASQVLRLLCRGDTEKEVARKLGIARNTAHVYVKELHRKLGVSSRGELIARAYKTSDDFVGAVVAKEDVVLAPPGDIGALTDAIIDCMRGRLEQQSGAGGNRSLHMRYRPSCNDGLVGSKDEFILLIAPALTELLRRICKPPEKQ